MHLSKHDLQQMNEDWLQSLPSPVLLEVSKRLLADVKSLQDQLHQNPSNSSRPPSSQPLWDKQASSKPPQAVPSEAQPLAPTGQDKLIEDVDTTVRISSQSTVIDDAPARSAGRQPGSAGHGRTQKLAVTATLVHRPSQCTACGCSLPADRPGRSYTAWDEIELERSTGSALALHLSVTRHQLLQVRCDCDHVSRAQPWRANEDALWQNVTPGQWRLLGPRLAALIVMLSRRMRLSRQRIQELLQTLFGLELSTGLIDQTIRETGRMSEPLEEALVADLHQAQQVYVDETGWPESGLVLWLWVLVSAQTVLYLIGPRSRDMLDNALDASFAGILMSDGYMAYRQRSNRLRCWAHLLRKARGLAQSVDQRAAALGQQMQELFERLQTAVYAARLDAPGQPLEQVYATDIEQLHQLCERHRDDTHQPLRTFARELLNDWEVIMRPLAQPDLPLTNNAAERALRHWVIARRISHGTRTPAGSRAFALLASVIDTCRLRSACAWHYLGELIAAARQGDELPPLPMAAA